MSRKIILAYLLSSLFPLYCVRRVDYPYEYALDKDRDGEDDMKNYLEARRDGTSYDYDIRKLETDFNMDTDDTDEVSTPVFIKPTKSWLNMDDPPPAVRTDVVFRLQEKLSGSKMPLLGDANYDGDQWAWPLISLRTKITPLTLPTPPLRRTRTFRDHFLTIKYNMLNRYTFTKTTKYISSSTSSQVIDPFDTFTWRRNFRLTTSVPWYLTYKYNTPRISLLGKWYNTSKTSPLTTDMMKYVGKLRESLFSVPNRSSLTTGTVGVTRITPTRTTSQYDFYVRSRAPVPGRQNADEVSTTTTTTTTESTTTTTTVPTTTTTTTTRTTRAYPHPKWICYECGRNETKFGSSFCHNVFTSKKDDREFAKRRGLHYKCNGHKNAVNQCFKRFLDIGHYDERGCRDFPPRRSGKTYVSKRLRALEKMLHDVTDGCTFSPHASLVPFSRPVQLYARFYVCVCKGRLCNSATDVSSRPWLIFLAVIVSIYCGRITFFR